MGRRGGANLNQSEIGAHLVATRDTIDDYPAGVTARARPGRWQLHPQSGPEDFTRSSESDQGPGGQDILSRLFSPAIRSNARLNKYTLTYLNWPSIATSHCAQIPVCSLPPVRLVLCLLCSGTAAAANAGPTPNCLQFAAVLLIEDHHLDSEGWVINP
jgi:hypothetical protein